MLAERPSLSSAVRSIAEEVLTVSYDDIPAAELHQAKRLLLDTLGCALASRDCAAAQAVVASLDDLGGLREATVLGTGERTSALNAILANGAMVRFLDLNDVQSSASLGRGTVTTARSTRCCWRWGSARARAGATCSWPRG